MGFGISRCAALACEREGPRVRRPTMLRLRALANATRTGARLHHALAPWRPPASRRRAGPYRVGRNSAALLVLTSLVKLSATIVGARRGRTRVASMQRRACESLNHVYADVVPRLR